MKIERISENQIKCTLNRSDLASRQIKMSELAYGTEKTRGLFQDMMAQAENEVGFEARDLPLMIEAIPVSMDCVVLMITKVEDPDELDPKFGDLAKFDHGNSQPDDLSYLLDDKSFKDLLDEVDSAITKNTSSPVRSNVKSDYVSVERIYSFDSLDTVIEFAHHTGKLYDGENSLYKSRDDGRYYLKLVKNTKISKQFESVCATALEYGRKEPFGYARSAFLQEHYDIIINENAIQSLANV